MLTVGSAQRGMGGAWTVRPAASRAGVRVVANSPPALLTRGSPSHAARAPIVLAPPTRLAH